MKIEETVRVSLNKSWTFSQYDEIKSNCSECLKKICRGSSIISKEEAVGIELESVGVGLLLVDVSALRPGFPLLVPLLLELGQILFLEIAGPVVGSIDIKHILAQPNLLLQREYPVLQSTQHAISIPLQDSIKFPQLMSISPRPMFTVDNPHSINQLLILISLQCDLLETGKESLAFIPVMSILAKVTTIEYPA